MVSMVGLLKGLILFARAELDEHAPSVRHVLAVDAGAVALLPARLAARRFLATLVAYIQRDRRPQMRDPPNHVEVQVRPLHRRKGLLAVRPAHLGLVRLHLRH